jgi:hypothetical protein
LQPVQIRWHLPAEEVASGDDAFGVNTGRALKVHEVEGYRVAWDATLRTLWVCTYTPEEVERALSALARIAMQHEQESRWGKPQEMRELRALRLAAEACLHVGIPLDTMRDVLVDVAFGEPELAAGESPEAGDDSEEARRLRARSARNARNRKEQRA